MRKRAKKKKTQNSNKVDCICTSVGACWCALSVDFDEHFAPACTSRSVRHGLDSLVNALLPSLPPHLFCVPHLVVELKI